MAAEDDLSSCSPPECLASMDTGTRQGGLPCQIQQCLALRLSGGQGGRHSFFLARLHVLVHEGAGPHKPDPLLQERAASCGVI